MKELFNKKYLSYNNLGRELTEKVEQSLTPIMEYIRTENINIIEAENIMISTIGIMFAELRLINGYNNRRR